MSAPSQIGPYSVEREIGRGGMGVVFLARDPRLERRAAIKALPVEFAQDPERLARFEREARLLASLTHPNIAAVYGLEEKDGARYLVMEYVEGRTLAEVLASGPLPVDEALEVGAQIAAGLEAAHEAGVIHRDLKPGNVIVTAAGKAKVLDFGLAKSMAPGAASSSSMIDTATMAHRATLRATGAGNVVGTPGYLSPEQARGKALDKRTDVWAFGCVLFECLAGRQLYSGETVSDVIAAILEREPDWSRLPERTPGRVRELLSMCLEKDQSKRLRDMGDVRLELERAIAGREWSSSSLSMRAAPAGRGRRGAWWRGAAVLLVGAALGAGVWWVVAGRRDTGHVPSKPQVIRASVRMPEGMSGGSVGISPDGSQLICRVSPDAGRSGGVFVRPLGADEARLVPGTEGAREYFGQSYDGKWLGFRLQSAGSGGRGELLRVPADGSGPPAAFYSGPEVEASFSRAVWLRDGDILLQSAPTGPYLRISPEGAVREPSIKAEGDETFDNVIPGWALPDGRTITVEIGRYTGRGWSVSAGLMDLSTGRVKRLTDGGNLKLTRTGHAVFSRGDRLMGVAFDAKRGEFVGAPIALIAGLQTADLWSPGWFDVSSETGTLVYSPGGVRGAKRRLVFRDPAGKLEPWSDEEKAIMSDFRSSVSRDGTRIAVTVGRPDGLFEVHVAERDRPMLRPLAVSTEGDCSAPRVSPDGQRVAYAFTTTNFKNTIRVTPFDGGSESVVLAVFDRKEDAWVQPAAWFPDGKQLLLDRSTATQSSVLAIPATPAEGSRVEARVVLGGESSYSSASFSPDGKWLAYISNESGRNEAYIRAWEGDRLQGAPLRVSAQGASSVEWEPDGMGVRFSDGRDHIVYRVPVTLGASVSVGKPVELYDADELGVISGIAMPEGGTLLVIKGPEERAASSVNVIVNWFEELKAKVPLGGAGESKP